MPPATIESERDIETKLLQPLFHQTLGYPDSDLKFAVPVKLTLGREKRTKEADLVVYHNGKPVVVVEAKKPTETLQSGIDQVDSYAFSLQTPYSVVTNGRGFILRGYYSFNSRINILEESVEELKKDGWKKLKELISFANVLASIADQENEVAVPDEEKIKDYRRFFRSLHNIIRDGDKLDPSASFDEMSKILFLKAAEDEWLKREGGQPVLTSQKIDEWGSKGMEFVNSWFSETAHEFYPDVFEENTKINLSIDTLKSVLKAMKGFHVRDEDNDIDVKGRAFEEFLPSQLRGKGLGQFFTPRPVVNFMVDMAEISIHDVVVDFACGSGGFLIKAFERMHRLADQLPDGTWKRLGGVKNEFLNDLKTSQLFGIDAEPRAARTAKMNMLMWGDGRRVVRGNSLDVEDFNGKHYEPEEYKPNKESGCTLILANPPFGSNEKKQDILKRYELGGKNAERTSQKTEILFLEKGVKLLRPQGKMLIVIPQGVLSNESYSYVRDFLHSEVEIRGIVSLPTHTFVQSGVQTVKTCVLYVQKFTEEKKRLYDERTKGKDIEDIRAMLRVDPDFNYPIFMGTAEFIGYEPSGRSIVKKGEKTDLHELLEDFQKQGALSRPDVDLIAFAKAHYNEKPLRRADQIVRGTQKGLKTSFVMPLSEMEDRLDPPYYLLREQAGKMLQSFTPLSDGMIEKAGKRFKPSTEDEMDAEYSILSVTNDGKISLNEVIRGEEFTQSYKRVQAGDIAYNPYRVNIGSIGVVPEELNGGFVSPAYVVFRSKRYHPQFLVNLLRSPFYKMYIDVVSTGSIRDSLSYDLLSTIRVPEVNDKEQERINADLHAAEEHIEKLLASMDEQKESIVETMHSLLSEGEDNPHHLEDFNEVLRRSAKDF